MARDIYWDRIVVGKIGGPWIEVRTVENDSVRRCASDKYGSAGYLAEFAKTRESRDTRYMQCMLVTRASNGLRRWHLSLHVVGLEHRLMGDTIDRFRRGCTASLVLRMQQISRQHCGNANVIWAYTPRLLEFQLDRPGAPHCIGKCSSRTFHPHLKYFSIPRTLALAARFHLRSPTIPSRVLAIGSFSNFRAVSPTRAPNQIQSSRRIHRRVWSPQTPIYADRSRQRARFDASNRASSSLFVCHRFTCPIV